MPNELIKNLQKARIAMLDARGISNKYEDIIHLIAAEIMAIEMNNILSDDDLSLQD